MITELTPEQQKQLPATLDRWLAHGLSTEPADRPAAEDGVCQAYAAAGLAPPAVFVWLNSPMAGCLAAAMLANPSTSPAGDQVGAQVGDQVWAQVRAQVGAQVWAQVGDQVRAQVGDQVWAQVGDQVGDQVRAQVRAQVWAQVGAQVGDQVGAQVRDQVWAQVRAQVGDQVRAQVRDQVWAQVYKSVWGQHDAGWLSFYDAMGDLGIRDTNRLAGLMQVARSAGWWWPFTNLAILTERPTALHRDPENRLHHETGAALLYPDGWGLHAWHGTLVPPDLIEGDGWSTEQILTADNQEIRRCAIERIGWDRFIDRANLARVGDPVPDPGNPGNSIALYDVPEQIYDEPVRVLLCTNGTVERDGTRRRFGLTVPAEISDPVAAAAWTYDWSAAAYAQLARRA